MSRFEQIASKLDASTDVWQYLKNDQLSVSSEGQKILLLTQRAKALDLVRTIINSLDYGVFRIADIPKEIITKVNSLLSALNSFESDHNTEAIYSELKKFNSNQTLITTWMLEKTQKHSITVIKDVQSPAQNIIKKSKSIEKLSKTAEKNEQIIVSASRNATATVSGILGAKKEVDRLKLDVEKSLQETSQQLKQTTTLANAAKADRVRAENEKKKANKAADLAEQQAVKLNLIVSESNDYVSNTQDKLSKLLGELTTCNEKANEILFSSNTAGLAETWVQKKRAAAYMMVVYGAIIFVFLGFAIIVSLSILVQSFSPVFNSFGTVPLLNLIAIKLVASLPIVFAIWFSAKQFTASGKRYEKYESLQALAQSLEANRKYLIRIAEESPADEELHAKVANIIVGSVEKLTRNVGSYDTVQPTSTNSEAPIITDADIGTIRKCLDTVLSLIKK